MVIWTFGSQSTSSDHSQWRLPSSPSRVARMFTTSSKSVNSKRWGVSASRSLGPISGSRSIIANTSSMQSRSSRGDSNEAPTAQLFASVDPLAAAGLRAAVVFFAAAGLRARLLVDFTRPLVDFARPVVDFARLPVDLARDVVERFARDFVAA